MRSSLLRFGSLVITAFGQQLLWHSKGHGQAFEIIQGFSAITIVFSSSLLLLQRWLFQIAKIN